MTAARRTDWRFENFELDLSRASFSCSGRSIDLRPKAFDVLVVLIENAGRLVTKDQIMSAVWPDVVVTEDSLVRCIHEIRLALGDAGPRIIKTLPRRGYMFTAQVAGSTPQERVVALLDESKAEQARLAQRQGHATRVGLLAVGSLVGLLCLGVAIPDRFAARPLTEPLSIAVDGFIDLTGEKKALGRILTEEVLTTLTMFPDLKVVGPDYWQSENRARYNAVVRYRLVGSITPPAQAGNVTVRLVNGRSDEQLWSKRYAARIEDGERTASGLAQEIAANVASTISLAEAKQLSRQPAKNLSPHELVLRAQQVSFRSASRASTNEARALAQRAIDIDPDYAPAHVEFGKTFYRAFVLEWEGAQALEKAHAAAQHAVLIDQASADAYELLGRVYLRRRHHDAAIATLEKAIRLNPNRAASYASLADALTFSGRARDAIAQLETAIRLDPNYPPLVELYHGRALYFAGEYGRAALVLEACVARAPAFRPCYMYITAVYAELGRLAEARQTLAKLHELSPRFTVDHSVRRHLPYVHEPMLRFTTSLAKTGAQ